MLSWVTYIGHPPCLEITVLWTLVTNKCEGIRASPCPHSPCQVGVLGSGGTGEMKQELLGGQKELGVELLTLEVPCSLCKAIESLK